MNPSDHGEPDDVELVARARDGDAAALETLLGRHHRRIHLLCHRMCRDRGDAEDATQNALLAIVRGLARFDGTAAFTTWSHRVATNACLDELRRRSRRPVVAPIDDDRHDGSGPDSTVGGIGTHPAHRDPAEHVVAGERRTALQRALAELPEEFRVPVVLRDVGELDYAEIAELLDLAPGTVRSRISRGRRRLAAALRDDPAITSTVSASDMSASNMTASNMTDGTGDAGNPAAIGDVGEGKHP